MFIFLVVELQYVFKRQVVYQKFGSGSGYYFYKVLVNIKLYWFIQWFNVWSLDQMICIVGMVVDYFIDLKVLRNRVWLQFE